MLLRYYYILLRDYVDIKIIRFYSLFSLDNRSVHTTAFVPAPSLEEALRQEALARMPRPSAAAVPEPVTPPGGQPLPPESEASDGDWEVVQGNLPPGARPWQPPPGRAPPPEAPPEPETSEERAARLRRQSNPWLAPLPGERPHRASAFVRHAVSKVAAAWLPPAAAAEDSDPGRRTERTERLTDLGQGVEVMHRLADGGHTFSQAHGLVAPDPQSADQPGHAPPLNAFERSGIRTPWMEQRRLQYGARGAAAAAAAVGGGLAGALPKPLAALLAGAAGADWADLPDGADSLSAACRLRSPLAAALSVAFTNSATSVSPT